LIWLQNKSAQTEAATTDAFSICEDLPEDALDPARCLNDQAVWLLSSARPGCGINALLSDNVSTMLHCGTQQT
jgi:hypothetical protein